MAAALPAIAIGMALVGTAGQTYAQIRAAQMQSKLATREATGIRVQAKFEEGQFRLESAGVLAERRALGAASGVDISRGSPLLNQLEQVKRAELGALNIRQQGEFAARSKELEAKYARRSIPGILAGGTFGVGGTLLSGMSFYNRRPGQ